MKRLFIIIALVFVNSLFVSALEPTWSIDFGSVFDNREGNDLYNEDKTFFFTTLTPQLGLKFTEKDIISGGVTWNQPLENGVKNGKVMPVLYYRHSGEKWKFAMGMFPRTLMREPLPGFLWSDSLAYFQRTVRGALVEYDHRNGFLEAYIDWRTHQSETDREAFNLMLHGEWKPEKKAFLAGGHILMNHLAKTRNPADDERIVDNFLLNPYVGLDFSKKTVMDSLVIKVGGIMTIERYREHKGWDTPVGFWMDIVCEWKFLGLRNSFYGGGKLFPLYSEFGNLLYQGESYYSSNLYDRLDIYGHIYRNKYIDLEAQLNFNFTKDNFMFYQRLILNIHLDSGEFGWFRRKK